MVNVGALTLQLAYAKEIWKYDRKRRHYFTITKMLRLILVLVRFVFPSIFVHAWVDKRGWHFRRELLELEHYICNHTRWDCVGFLDIKNNGYGNDISGVLDVESRMWDLRVYDGGYSYIFAFSDISCRYTGTVSK